MTPVAAVAVVSRRRFLLAALAGVLATPRAARARASAKTWRIGYLSLVSGDLEPSRAWIGSLRDGLRELGYVEGNNVVIDERYAAGQVDRLPGLATELVRRKVDILVAAPSGSAFAAQRVTSTVPIVFIGEPDPVGSGLVGSLARPGGNTTGLADAHADLLPKRLERLRELTPSGQRIGVLWNPANASSGPQVKAVQAVAPSLGLTVVSVEVNGPGHDDLDRAFATIAKSRLGGLLVIADPMLGNQRTRIAELSIAHRLPASGTHRAWAEAGLLMSYGTDFIALFRHGAAVVDKILRGARPADLPVEQPTKFELVVNLKTAQALGLRIPPSLLARADHLIDR